MKKIIVKILCVAMVFAMLVPCFTSCGDDELEVPKFSEATINIGASGPLTGPAAVYGIAVRNAAKLAVHEINAAGGLDGIMFAFEMYDDKHDPTTVANGYASFEGKGMQISLGTVTTGPALEYKELSKDKIFVLTPSASGDKVPEYANAYQMCFADSNQGKVSAEVFNVDYAGKKIGVFYKSDDDYSKGIYTQFKANLSAELAAGLVEASFKGEESDFAQQVNALKDCDVIFMPIYYTPASQFMTAGKNKVKADAVYYGCDGLDGIDAIQGFDVNSIPQEISYLSHFNSNATTGAAATFIAAYNEAFDETAEPLNQFGAAAYDCVYAIFNALKAAKAAGKSFDASTSAADFLEILTEQFNGEFVYNGITGEPDETTGKSAISWDSTGFVNKQPVKYTVKEAN